MVDDNSSNTTLSPENGRAGEIAEHAIKPIKLRSVFCMLEAALYLLVLILGAVAIMVAVLVSQQRRDSSVPSAVSSRGTPIPVPSMGPSHGKEYLLDQKLRRLLGIDPDPLSIQGQALHWMAYSDFEISYYLDHLESDRKDATKRVAQRFALIMTHLSLGRWDEAPGWVSSLGALTHECLWPGITCDHETQTVRELDLNPRLGTLRGSIPFEMGLLSQLEVLHITGAELNGTVPLSLYSLSRLYYFSLAGNSMAAPLSPFLANLTRLAWLELTDGGFSGPVPSEWGSLEQLRYLFLDHNALTGTIPSSLGQLWNLEKATFQQTMLTGSMPESLCQLRLAWLRVLTAHCNSSFSCSCCTECF